MHILVVEDDRPLARILRKSIESSGHTVDIVGDGDEALRVARTRAHDALVLDLQLPRLSGIEVCRRLRDDGNAVPIIMLTARGAVADRIEGLDVGADDYLPKPFSLAELQARLRALHRRGKVEPELLRSGSLELDTTARELRVNGTSVELTGTELALLEYLMRNAGRVISKTMILSHVWEYSFDTQTNVVDVLVSRLRDKIDRPYERKLVQTVRGVGYVLR